MEYKEEELKRRVDVAIGAAHQLWKKQQEGRVEAMLYQLKKEWGAQYRTERDVRSKIVPIADCIDKDKCVKFFCGNGIKHY